MVQWLLFPENEVVSSVFIWGGDSNLILSITPRLADGKLVVVTWQGCRWRSCSSTVSVSTNRRWERRRSCAAELWDASWRSVEGERGRKTQNGDRAVLKVHGRTKGVSSGTWFLATQTDTLCRYDSFELSRSIKIDLCRLSCSRWQSHLE